MRLTPHVYQLCGNMYGSTDNIYAIDAGDSLVLVDTGLGKRDLDIVLKNMAYWDLSGKPVSHVLLTHEHFEHISNAAYFQKQGALIVCGTKCAEAIAKGGLWIGEHRFPEAVAEPFEADIVLDEGRHELAGLSVEVIETPGHSEGSLLYIVKTDGEEIVFSGDTILLEMLCHKVRFGWTGGIDFNEEKLVSSMKKISELEADVLLPGHGEVCLYQAHRQFFGAWLRARLDFSRDHHREYLFEGVKHAGQ